MIRDEDRTPEFLNDMQNKIEKTLRLAGSYLEGKIKEKITNTDPEWPPLKPETIKRKGSSKPLIDTGKLRNSIVHNVELEKKRVLVGVFSQDVATYAAVHEFGAPRRNIPQRSYLRKTFDEEVENLSKLIDEALR